uniref:Uncharacterized protein n=1 Tax=Ditylenchus dipsaci TaxID=166011 RepID=A0A915D1R9_9BILA
MTAAAKKMCAHVIKEVLLPALDATSTFMSYEVLCKQITGQCISNIEKPDYETKLWLEKKFTRANYVAA